MNSRGLLRSISVFLIFATLNLSVARASEVSSNKSPTVVGADKSFVTIIEQMNHQQRLAKILELKREIRRVKEQVDKIDDEKVFAEENHAMAKRILEITLIITAFTLVFFFGTSGDDPILGFNFGNMHRYLQRPIRATFLLNIPPGAFFFITRGSLASLEDKKREVEVRLWELQDRLGILEKITQIQLQKGLDKDYDENAEQLFENLRDENRGANEIE
ncbi:MAG: hypothetical protein AB7F43_08090 [Bacteriovoracia bacterium]